MQSPTKTSKQKFFHKEKESYINTLFGFMGYFLALLQIAPNRSRGAKQGAISELFANNPPKKLSPSRGAIWGYFRWRLLILSLSLKSGIRMIEKVF